MAVITETYKQKVPAARFIGKKYSDSDRIGGSFSSKWSEWFSNDWFSAIEKLISPGFKEVYADADAYLGLMRWKDGEPFEYWIGMFTPDDAAVPEGYGYVDFPESTLGVCWVYGKQGEVYGREGECSARLTEKGYKIIPDGKGAWWFFERYGCPRFTTPDDKGNIILDICHYIE